MILRLNFICEFLFPCPCSWIKIMWLNLTILAALFSLWSSNPLPHYILLNGVCVWFIAIPLLPIASFLLTDMMEPSDKISQPVSPPLPLGPEADSNGSPLLANSGSSAHDLPPITQPLPPSSTGSFSNVLRFGVDNPHSSLPPVTQPPAGRHPIPPNPEATDPCVPLPVNADTPTPLDDLRTFCLLAKLWGDSLPVPLIISKLK